MKLKEPRQELGSSTNLSAFPSTLPPSILKHIYAFSGILKLITYLGKSQVWFDLYKFGNHKSIKGLVPWMLL